MQTIDAFVTSVFEGKDPINRLRTQAVFVAEQITVMSRPERKAADSWENQKGHNKFLANAANTGQNAQDVSW